jgi:hypothetical protein
MTWGNLLRFVVVMLLMGGGSVLEADVFNIKVLSDNAPDLTDLPSFAASATDNWTTNDEKARAFSYWMFGFGDQASSNHDWEPVEPILTFNNLPNPGYCAHWTACSQNTETIGRFIEELAVNGLTQPTFGRHGL